MTDHDVRIARHGELWKEQNRQLARWAMGLALFAGIALVKVLVPYADLSAQLLTQQTELARVQNDLKEISAERARLAEVGQQLQALRAVIERQPWMAERDQLVQGLRDLSQAHDRLRRTPPEQVLQAVRDAASPGGAMATTAQAPPTAQAARQLDRQGVIPATSSSTQPGLAAQAALLGLEPARLAGIGARDAWHRYLDERLDRQVQRAADEKVRRIVGRVEEAITAPLERLLPSGDGPGPRELRSQIVQLRAGMEQWAREHIGNRVWYETIQQKDRELHDLTGSLRSRQAAFGAVLAKQQRALQEREKARADHQRSLEARAVRVDAEAKQLDGRMERLLPDWIRGLVSLEEMLQLYPAALLGLVGMVSIKAWQVRRHYLVVREGYRARGVATDDAAMSSLWTLVDRGAIGTTLTAGVYLGGAALVWWLFEHGLSLAHAWFPAHPSASWAWLAPWLPLVRWAGRAAFAAILVGVPVVLLRDRAARMRPTPRPSDGPVAGVSGAPREIAGPA